MSVKLQTEHDLEFLSLKGGCTGSSESTFVKLPHCWKSHVMANLLFISGEGGENTPAAVTLSKTNVIAIGVSITAVVIALGVILAFFIVRHKRLQRSFRAFANSHYDSRSGTTTFTAADELGRAIFLICLRSTSAKFKYF